MPTPKKGESKEDFMQRCIPVALNEKDTKNREHAFAKCNGMWEQNKNG